MYRNTRYDRQDYSALGLAPSYPTTGRPLTPSGESLVRSGARAYIVGHGFHAQTYGAMYCTPTRAEMDTLLDRLSASGVNAISCMEMEQYGLVISGSQAGRPAGCYDIGYQYTTNKTWAAGAKCYTEDSTGIVRVRRVYRTPAGGVSSGGSSTGPTGTGTGIAVGGVTWDYVEPAYRRFNESFFRGDGNAAGFDYFLDACSRRGIYVAIRFDRWDAVFAALTSGYLMNGHATNGSSGNLTFWRGTWGCDGTSGTPNCLQAMKDHVTAWLDRVNSVNGRRYGDDHTISTIDCFNEQGVAAWYFGTSSISSPTSNTFDYLCRVGSTTPGTDQLNSAYVAWWDAKWLAWYAATYPGHTPNGDFPGKLNTLPCYAYTGAMGPNIAARSTYRAGTFAEGWTTRVAAFLSFAEAEFVTAMRTHIRSKSSHILRQFGQNSYMFPASLTQGDVIDNHNYPSATTTNGNPVTDTITSGGGKGMSWVAGTLTVVFSAAPTRSLLVGQSIRMTQTSGGSWTDVVVIATVFTTTTANDSFTATGVADPVSFAGTQVSATAELPTIDANTWPFHIVTATDTTSTRMHWYATPGTESDYDRNSGWLGQTGIGPYSSLPNNMFSGLPCTCTELGMRGITGPVWGLHRITYTLLDLLQGGSGAYAFTWNNSTLQPGAGEHAIPGDGSALLDAQVMTLMARYITPFTVEDLAQFTQSDTNTFFAKRNTTDLGGLSQNGHSFAYIENAVSGMWQTTLNRRARASLGAVSAPSTQSYTVAATGWTHPVLNNAATGLFYVWIDMGVVVYENAKIVIVVGRIPPDSTTKPLPLSKLQCSTTDAKAWYGRIVWASLDGSDLGVGRSALYTWCYPREQMQMFRRMQIDAGPVVRAEMLNNDASGINTSDAATQPGVVMRNGLRVKLTMAGAKAATVPERYGAMRTHGAHYKSGALWVYPTRPLIVIG